MQQEPCEPWPLDPDCSYGIPPEPGQQSPAQQAAVAGASELLWRWTAGVFGLCTRVVRPCRYPCTGGLSPSGPVLHMGQWLNVACGCPPGGCGCGPLCEVPLPGPVDSVVQVLVDGVLLPGSAYRVDNWSMLVRTDGGCWPACQFLEREVTEPGTWEVTYRQGNAVPSGGRRAVGALAAELVRLCGTGRCRLPGNATTVTREGTSVMLDVSRLAEEPVLGLPEVDMWVSAVNPHRLRQRPAVFSPDVAAPRVVTAPGLPVVPLSGPELAAADGPA